MLLCHNIISNELVYVKGLKIRLTKYQDFYFDYNCVYKRDPSIDFNQVEKWIYLLLHCISYRLIRSDSVRNKIQIHGTWVYSICLH